jgi:hypothetical protein
MGFLDYDGEIRKIICSTKSLNAPYRAMRARGARSTLDVDRTPPSM